MKYFIDTEFIEGFHRPLFGKKRHFIDLISIAIVAEDGREYYAISREFNPKDADDWVKENVIDKLPEKYFNGSNIHHAKLWKSNEQIAKDIRAFIYYEAMDGYDGMCTSDYYLEQTIKQGLFNPEFYAYYADYDWVVFCSLFGRMIDLPSGFPMYCRDLKQMLDEKADGLSTNYMTELAYPGMPHDVFINAGKPNTNLTKVHCLKQAKNFPVQENEHSALDDAKWNKKLYDFLKSI